MKLVGRALETEKLQLLLEDEIRFIQVTSSPGIGKKTFLSQLVPPNAVRPDHADQENFIDLLHWTWEQLYDTGDQGVVSPLRTPTVLATFDGFVLIYDADPFATEIALLRQGMPEATFLTTSVNEVDATGGKFRLAELTDREEMFTIFDRNYRLRVPESLTFPITEMCAHLNGHPELIVRLAKGPER